jgi:hypothetical protein
MRNRKPLTPTERRSILRDLNANMSFRGLAKRHLCSVQTIRNIHKKYRLVGNAVIKKMNMAKPGSVHQLSKVNEAIEKAYGHDPLEELISTFRQDLAALKADIIGLSINLQTGEVEVDYLTHNKFTLSL